MISDESRFKLSTGRKALPRERTRGGAEAGNADARLGKLGGTLISAIRERERVDRIRKLQSVLVPGEFRIRQDRDTKFVLATRNGVTVDVTDMLAPGSHVIRRRPDGDVTYAVTEIGLVPNKLEGYPPRLSIMRTEDGAITNIGLEQLMGIPDDSGKSWQIPVPVE